MTVISILFNCLCIANYKSQTNKGEGGRKHFSAFFVGESFIYKSQNYTDLRCLLDIKVLT